MKKILPTLALALAFVLALTGCAKKEDSAAGLTDGTYRTEMSQAYAADQGHGWQGFVELTVTDGAVSDVVFDYTNEEGALKSEQSKEEYPMDPHPSQWIPALEEQGKNASAPQDIDGVTGATSSSEEFKELYAAALTAAAEGNKDTVVLH